MRAASRLVVGLALVLLLGCAAPALAQDALAPTDQQLYHDGPTNRFLLAGTWLFRRDARDAGLGSHWERQGSTAGWSRVSVPYAWNSTNDSEDAYIGGPAWYRRDFTLPAGRRGSTWVVRFESVTYRSTIWLNGRLVGTHTGSYLPFEIPLTRLRAGVNRLVVRTDNRHLPTDFPPSRYTRADTPGGGWWNYGGITREVYLRRVDGLDLASVQVRPVLPCPTCSARIAFAVAVRNPGASAQRVRLTATFGTLAVRFRSARLAAGQVRTLRASVLVANPHLWWPSDPYLYDVGVQASGAGGASASWILHSGIRSIAVSGGRLLLNGQPLSLRGVAIHEDVPGKGEAMDDADREAFMAGVKDVGATIVRAHHPLHPYFYELADRLGVLMWSEVPVYRMVTSFLTPRTRAAAVDLVRENVADNGNHPSILVWSIGNELQDDVPPPVRAYISAAARAAHKLDPSRPVGMAIEGHPQAACVGGYGPLDVIGLNDYFGWYDDVGPREQLSPYLDQMHACHPNQALMVTEFGAEANRDGAVTEKGTYQFQQDFVRYHLGVMATKPWLNGAIYWTLREFRCRPNWAGGNPLPQPPLHQKGLVSYAGQPKPAYADAQQIYRSTVQVPGEPPPTGP